MFGWLLALIPFYPLCKVVFLIWSFSPTFKGAVEIYTAVKPLLVPYILGPDAAGPPKTKKVDVLKLTVKTVKLNVDGFVEGDAVYCEVKVEGKEGRPKCPCEGISYKSHPLIPNNGETAFDEKFEFKGLDKLDGKIMFELKRKPTFEDIVSIGHAEILVSDVTKKHGEEIEVLSTLGHILLINVDLVSA